MLVWIVSGGGFGLLMSWGIQIWVKKTGESKYYDWCCKIILLIGLTGFLIAGILLELEISNFGVVIISFTLVCICYRFDRDWINRILWLKLSLFN